MLDRLDLQIPDPTALSPGDEVDVWSHRTLLWAGVVEQTAPELGVLWIREARNGTRRLLSTAEHRLTRRPAVTAVTEDGPSPAHEEAARRWAW
ncbi:MULTISPECIES: hypothetical protein [Kocuria]|uniref:hypothetical protein n=1 Tax=Kocuria TaxID=57493 RepID=UPI00203F5CB2|nr:MULTISPECIES: hypothetical protein [Kocuria]MCM3686728.1 hypothetical protein [Kocuria rosea]HST73596.1 hypothetical protein [Kocuria rosea]